MKVSNSEGRSFLEILSQTFSKQDQCMNKSLKSNSSFRFDASLWSQNHKNDKIRRKLLKTKKSNENKQLFNKLDDLIFTNTTKISKDDCCAEEFFENDNFLISNCYTDLDHEEVKRLRRNKLQRKTYPSTISQNEDFMSDPQPKSNNRITKKKPLNTNLMTNDNNQSYCPQHEKMKIDPNKCIKRLNTSPDKYTKPRLSEQISHLNNNSQTTKFNFSSFKKNVVTAIKESSKNQTAKDKKPTRTELGNPCEDVPLTTESVNKHCFDQSLPNSNKNGSKLFTSGINNHQPENTHFADSEKKQLKNFPINQKGDHKLPDCTSSICTNAKFSNLITLASENSNYELSNSPNEPLNSGKKAEVESCKLDFVNQNMIVEQLREENLELKHQLSLIKNQYDSVLPLYHALLESNKDVSLVDNERKNLVIKNQELQKKVTDLLTVVAETGVKNSCLEEQLKLCEKERSRMFCDAEDLRSQLKNYHKKAQKIECNYEKNLSFKKLEQENDLKLRDMHNKIIELKGNIRVMARFKMEMSSPQGDIATNSDLYHFKGSDSVTLTHKLLENNHNFFLSMRPQRTYTFNRVFRQTSKQEEIFSEVSPYITSCVDGYNVCIMTYGQTGSGKTFTMKGTNKAPGIIPQAVHQIFTECQERKMWKYDLYISILQIYNESMTDLLTETINRVYIHDDGSTVFIKGLQEFLVKNEDDIKHYIKLGRQRRSTAKTILNFDSSRSHFVVMLRVFGSSSLKGYETQGILTLCDLAGFERFSATDPHGKEATETKYISKSLTVLVRVFEALRTKRRSVPFRESKLTHLLKPSLSGDSKCVLILTLSAKQENVESSVRSLQFGTKAMITNLGLPKKNISQTIEEAENSINADCGNSN